MKWRLNILQTIWFCWQIWHYTEHKPRLIWMNSFCVPLSCFHVLLGNPPGNPGMIIIIQGVYVVGVCACRHVGMLRCVHTSVITALSQQCPSYFPYVTENQQLMADLLSLATDPWAWAAFHRCHQHRPAAARCVARTQMTCMPTWPARCPLPAPARPHQINPARSEGLHGTGLHMAETRLGVSFGNKSSCSRHTGHIGRLIHNSIHRFSNKAVFKWWPPQANKGWVKKILRGMGLPVPHCLSWFLWLLLSYYN